MFTFDSFVPGPANAAFDAALAIAEGTGAHNPLLLYGRMGSGKTHLVHAIEQRLRERKPEANILRTTAPALMHEFLTAARERAWDAFYVSLEQYDVLLIDELNMLAKMEASRNELLWILTNAAARGAVVVAAWTGTKHSVREIASKFASVVEVRYPAMNERMEIVRRIAAERRLTLSDGELRALAREHKCSPRELQSAIARIALERSLLPAH